MIVVHDQVIAEPQAYREAALSLTFQSVDVGHAVFRGIALCPSTELAQWFEAAYPQYRATLTFFRKSPRGQEEPNFIHTDVDMGDVTVILYLNPDPPSGDGTTFWRHKATGAVVGGLMASEVGKDAQAWERWDSVDAAFNRCAVFDAPYFHSRAIPENYGAGDDARLIQVLFGKLREN